MAGSSALALYLDHRPTHGLDLMSATNDLRSPARRDLLQDLLQLDPETRVETARDGYLYCRLGDGTALRFFHYPYSVLGTLGDLDGLAVAPLLDLALMKLGAVISRGSRRDFVDLFLIERHLPIATVLARSVEKFGYVRDFPLQALKGLADRTLARTEPMPTLAVDVEWSEVDAWAEDVVRELGRRHVGLTTGGNQ
ncbi:MAG: hypothetical protein AAGD38_14845 [Acidobacteriota bacterium]